MIYTKYSYRLSEYMSILIEEPKPRYCKSIVVTPEIYDRLLRVKQEKIGEKRCLVSFSTTLNEILNVYDRIMIVVQETVRK